MLYLLFAELNLQQPTLVQYQLVLV